MSDTSPPAGISTRLERLSGKDLRVLLIWILAGALGITVAWRYFFQAFPEASVNFQISPAQALERARAFVSQQGASLQGYQSTIVFSVDDNTKTYLERTAGLDQANHLISSDVNAWYWEIRFFRPQQKEEFRAQINPAGRIVGYDHIIEESRGGAKLDRDSAQSLAEKFLRAQHATDFESYDFLPEEANSTVRSNRLDWTFTWQRRDFHIPDQPDGAPYRLRVGLQGDQIGSTKEFLKIPDAWLRGYEQLRSSNNLIEVIALIPYLLLLGTAFWVIYGLARQSALHWTGPLWLGLFLTALFFLFTISNWSGIRAEYDTNSSYSAFLLEQIALAALLSLAQGMLVTLALAPAEPLYRASQPERICLRAAWKLPTLRSKEFFNSCIIGLSLAAIHLGYVVTFYLVGKRFGVWAPQDINFDSSTTTIVPWLGALTIGLYAACSEEFLFRLFAIPFLKRITKSTFIAVVLPAFAWGFLHSNYPQEPPYIRGIEIGLIGIAAGLVMLRWGILPTLIWHYTVDATLGSLLLMRSASLYARVSGALVAGLAVLPLLYAGVMYLARGGFEVREDLLNRAEPLPPPVPETVQLARAAGATKYAALSPGRIWALVLCGAAGLVILFAAHPRAIGDFVRVPVNRPQAIAAADDVLRQWHVDPSRFHRAVVFLSNFDPLGNEFLRRKIGIDGANRVYEQQVPQIFWRVRYFLDSDPEEYAVLFRADNGSLHSVWHNLDELTAGAKLRKEEAQARAEAWLRDNKHTDLSAWHLVGAESSAKPNRIDHLFTWQQNAPIAGGPQAENAAYSRIELSVHGDEVSTYRIYLKLPEEWVRGQQELTVPRAIQKYGGYLFAIAIVTFMLILYFQNLKTPDAAAIPWKRILRWSLWGFAAIIISAVTNFSVALHTYDPSQIPLKSFYAVQAIGGLVGATFFAGCILVAFGLAWFFWTRAGRGENLPGWMGMPANYYRDALLVAVAGGATWLGFSRLLSLLSQMWPTLRNGLPASVPVGFDALSPAAQTISGAVFTGLLAASMIAAVAGFVCVYVRSVPLRALLILVTAAAMMSGWGSGADFAHQLLFNIVLILFAWWGLSKFVRLNLLGFFLLVAAAMLATSGLSFAAQPNTYLRAQGIFMLGALALLLLWPLLAWLRGPANNISQASN